MSVQTPAEETWDDLEWRVRAAANDWEGAQDDGVDLLARFAAAVLDAMDVVGTADPQENFDWAPMAVRGVRNSTLRYLASLTRKV